MNALEIKHLYKGFSGHPVIRDLSLEVPEHSVFGFIGKNGAGKTTTMKMILGLLKPDQGEIRVFGEQVAAGSSKTNRHVGYLQDVPEFYGYMRPKEYLALCGEISGLPRTQIKRKSEELLGMVGLSGSNKKIGGFSRGMKQRLGIASALLSEPKLLICDEPTSALDPIGRKEILDILQQITGKTTVIFSTHILSDVERICDRVAVLGDGHILLGGDMNEVKAKNRRQKINVAFQDINAMERFLQLPEIAGLSLERDEMRNLVTFHSPDMKSLQKTLLRNMLAASIYPERLETAEVDLEDLFLEVVQ